MASFDLSINPAQIEFIIKPGASLTQAYTVTNNSPNTQYLTTEVLPWEPSGTDGNITFDRIQKTPEITFGLANADLKLNQSFVMPPNSSRQLVLKISASPKTALSDYYYTFFISQSNEDQFHSEGNVSQANGKIGSHILLSISPKENPTPKGEIKNFSVFPKIKDIFLTPITFKAEIENTSDYFYKSPGTLTVTKNNIEFKKLDINPNNVLAHHSRSITCPEISNCTLNPPFWPGRYTATLTLDENLNIKPVSVSFFVFPFSLIMFLFLLFLVVFVLVKFFKKTKTKYL
jgi:hypothetical protein